MEIVSRQLVEKLKEKKKLLEENNPKHKVIKTALVIDGGAMKGVWAAGVMAALHELGFDDVFDIVVAASSGAINAAYFLSKEGNIAPEVFSDGFANKECINLLKLHPQKIIGIDYFTKVFTKIKPIKQNVIKKSRSELYIGVTDPATGKGNYLDMKKEDIDIVTAIHASSAVPFLHNKMVTVHGKKYLDGMIGCGIPVTPALQRGCTDILIVENNPLEKPPFVNNFITKLAFMFLKSEITLQAKKAIFHRKEMYFETLNEISDAQNNGTSIAIIVPNKHMIAPLSINRKLLKQVAEEAKQLTLQLFL